MVEYRRVTRGRFVRRLNRFVAEVQMVVQACVEAGQREQVEPAGSAPTERAGTTAQLVHVKNTGRLKELLVSGAEVSLEIADNPDRKYRHSLIAVQKDGRWVNVDSQVPNQAAFEAIRKGRIRQIGPDCMLKREASFGRSRFDLYFEHADRRGFIEVKGVTLESEGIAMFPDAPTTRGTRHIYELVEAVKQGYEGIILFVIQMKGCSAFRPHHEMDLEFSEALRYAAKQGVQIIAHDAITTDRSITLDGEVPVLL